MVQPKLGKSKALSFPPYRRSHFRSQTYLSLVRIFSRLPSTLDSDNGKMEQEKLENGSESSESVGSASMDANDPIPKKIMQEAYKTTEGFGDKSKESDTNEVELMDFQVEHDEFQHYDVNILGNANELQVQRELTTTKEGELEKEEQCCPNMLANYARDEVLHIGSWEEDASQDRGSSFASKKNMDVIGKKKRCHGFEERKTQSKLSALENSPLLSKVCRPEMKSSLLSRNTSSSVPPNNRDISIQENCLINSMGNRSLINSESQAMDTVQKQLAKPPKGIRFINIGNSSLSSPSNPNQRMITKKKNIVQIRASADQSAFGTTKGVNFLSFLEYEN